MGPVHDCSGRLTSRWSTLHRLPGQETLLAMSPSSVLQCLALSERLGARSYGGGSGPRETVRVGPLLTGSHLSRHVAVL